MYEKRYVNITMVAFLICILYATLTGAEKDDHIRVDSEKHVIVPAPATILDLFEGPPDVQSIIKELRPIVYGITERPAYRLTEYTYCEIVAAVTEPERNAAYDYLILFREMHDKESEVYRDTAIRQVKTRICPKTGEVVGISGAPYWLSYEEVITFLEKTNDTDSLLLERITLASGKDHCTFPLAAYDPIREDISQSVTLHIIDVYDTLTTEQKARKDIIEAIYYYLRMIGASDIKGHSIIFMGLPQNLWFERELKSGDSVPQTP